MNKTEQKIKTALAFSGVTQAELAQHLGQSPQNLNKKLKRETLTTQELEQIAAALNADFEPFHFVFSDGTKL